MTDAAVSNGRAQPVAKSGATTESIGCTLHNVANGQIITVNLNNVTDTFGTSSNVVSSSMDVLIGDVNANGSVSGSDVNSCKTQVGINLQIDNFRDDVDLSGSISGSDVNH